MSVLSVPPAYHNLSTKRHPPQLLSPPGSGSDQTNDAGPSIKSVGNPNGLRSGRRLPETPRNEHSPFPSTSASLDNRASSEALSRFSYLSGKLVHFLCSGGIILTPILIHDSR